MEGPWTLCYVQMSLLNWSHVYGLVRARQTMQKSKSGIGIH